MIVALILNGCPALGERTSQTLTASTGGVVVFIYYFNTTDLQQSYIFLLNGFQQTRGIITN